MARERLDRLIHDLGHAPTREKARALIMAGRVFVDGQRADKAGTAVPLGARIEVMAPERTYASRGGDKLAGALDAFAVEVTGKLVLDLGASTGGFTDCLLGRGAARVYAVDVGRGLIDARLRDDPRVILVEGFNARFLSAAQVPELVDLATADLSFISLRLVLPALLTRVKPEGEILLLVKPQFELGRGEVGRGVVRDPALHARAITSVAAACSALGLRIRGVVASPLLGAKGNREFFLRATPAGEDAGASLEGMIQAAVARPLALP